MIGVPEIRSGAFSGAEMNVRLLACEFVRLR